MAFRELYSESRRIRKDVVRLGDDHGVQYAEPLQIYGNNPPPITANTLRVTAYGTIRNSDGFSVTYFFDMTNDGPGVSNYTVIGFGDIATGA